LFAGTGTALVTPFSASGVDYGSLGRLIDWQIDSGVDFLVILGTTGEAPAISESERCRIVSYSVEQVAGRIPVVVGAGGNNTEHAIENCRMASELGADGVLVVTPYYNKPSQEGLYRHFEAITQSVDIPIIAYNVPGRTGVNLLPTTLVRLASLPGIVGVKEASGSIGQADEIIASVKMRRPDFSVLSGNDDQAFHTVNSGGDGVISVLSNIAPDRVVNMITAARNGYVAEAREQHLSMLPLMQSLFMETNPMPVKYALSRLGYCENRLRLPLVPASDACMRRMDADLDRCGVTAAAVLGMCAVK
jgi:4-hydroxy-tetrahydrodipicolinate synthase